MRYCPVMFYPLVTPEYDSIPMLLSNDAYTIVKR